MFIAGQMTAGRLCWIVVKDAQSRPTSEPASTEHGGEASSEGRVHEAVGDGVTAGGREAEQVNEVHRCRRDVLDCAVVVEDEPRLKDVHRSPADEVLGHHHEQHLQMYTATQ